MTIPDPHQLPYAYHIAYQGQDAARNPRTTCFGSMTVYLSNPIDTPADMEVVKQIVARDAARDAGWRRANIIILSWQPFPDWGKGRER